MQDITVCTFIYLGKFSHDTLKVKSPLYQYMQLTISLYQMRRWRNEQDNCGNIFLKQKNSYRKLNEARFAHLMPWCYFHNHFYYPAESIPCPLKQILPTLRFLHYHLKPVVSAKHLTYWYLTINFFLLCNNWKSCKKWHLYLGEYDRCGGCWYPPTYFHICLVQIRRIHFSKNY